MNTLLHTPSYESSLSQTERLALCAGRFSPSVLGCDDEPLVRTIVPARFPSPSMARVRQRDGWLAFHGSPCNVASDATDEETDEESELEAFAAHKRRDAMREHSLLMPSQRGYAAAWQEAREYGFASE
jgi:hypothetical protein